MIVLPIFGALKAAPPRGVASGRSSAARAALRLGGDFGRRNVLPRFGVACQALKISPLNSGKEITHEKDRHSVVQSRAAVLPTALNSSDHADPIDLARSNWNRDHRPFRVSGRRPDDRHAQRSAGVNRPAPYQLEPFEYAIYMDVHSEVTFDNAAEKARYGGTVTKPDGIKEDVTIKIRLKNDATLDSPSTTVCRISIRSALETGVFDDPFIFPRFFNRNMIAMILSIPFSSFPDKDRKDWILWGTSTRLKDGVQIDHVGRSNRSQQGRFDFLNTLHPSKHVAAIKAHNQTRAQIERRSCNALRRW